MKKFMKEFWRKFDLWCFNNEDTLKGVRNIVWLFAFVLGGMCVVLEITVISETSQFATERRQGNYKEYQFKLLKARVDVLQEIVLKQEELKRVKK